MSTNLNRRSRVWEFFGKIETKGFAKCNLCGNEYKTSGNTTNLTDHLKRKHSNSSEWRKLIGDGHEHEDQDPRVDPSPSDTSESGCSSRKSRKTIKEYINRASFYADNSTRKKKLDMLYVRMIALDMEPLRKGEHEGFRTFVAGLDEKYIIPATTTLKTTLLPSYFADMKIKLQKALILTDNIALTTDMWTNVNNEGILALTSHFFYKGNLISPLLTAVKIEGRHTSEIMEKVSCL